MKETFKLVKDLKVLRKSSAYPQDYIKNQLKNKELVNQIIVDTKLLKGKDKKCKKDYYIVKRDKKKIIIIDA